MANDRQTDGLRLHPHELSRTRSPGKVESRLPLKTLNESNPRHRNLRCWPALKSMTRPPTPSYSGGASQTLTLPSCPTLARRVPSGENSRALTRCVCPEMRNISAPVSRSHR
jgi:hypothetical protein